MPKTLLLQGWRIWREVEVEQEAKRPRPNVKLAIDVGSAPLDLTKSLTLYGRLSHSPKHVREFLLHDDSSENVDMHVIK